MENVSIIIDKYIENGNGEFTVSFPWGNDTINPDSEGMSFDQPEWMSLNQPESFKTIQEARAYIRVNALVMANWYSSEALNNIVRIYRNRDEAKEILHRALQGLSNIEVMDCLIEFAGKRQR